jgi:hypothetical protein
MATVAGTTTIPIVIGLLVAVALFLAWAVQIVRSESAEADGRTASPAPQASPGRRPQPVSRSVSVQVVVGPHFTVAAPDDDAVYAAMSHRVRPPMPFPSPARTTPAHEEPAAAMPLPRSA